MGLQNLSRRGQLFKVLKGRGHSLPPNFSSLDGRVSVTRPVFRYSLTEARTRTLQTVACAQSRNKADRSGTFKCGLMTNTFTYQTWDLQESDNLITEGKQKGGSEAALLWLESLTELRFTQSAPKAWLTAKLRLPTTPPNTRRPAPGAGQRGGEHV